MVEIKPQIVVEDYQGHHNKDIEKSRDRLIQGNTYKDLSTIIIVPSRGVIPAKVVQNWLGMMLPMNQKVIRVFMIGMEVGEAYNAAIEMILNNPDLSKWKYVMTLEEDNMVPPDGLLKLYEAINAAPGYDVIGGLYWTKGEGGQPMIYGNVKDIPKNFIPQVPIPDTIMECNGLGMGCNLFRLEMFKDPKLQRPFFKTLQEHRPGVGTKVYTQDLRFFEDAGRLGYKFACATNVKVGHYDYERDIVW
jgi:glycosyltransferase involved in cell wall biosynthesis